MKLKEIIWEDFVNYKKPSMLLAFPKCSFKCDKEYGSQICQNCDLVKQLSIDVEPRRLVEEYLRDPISHAIVCAGLEPFDSPAELLEFVQTTRQATDDDIVIYTGYNKDELSNKRDDEDPLLHIKKNVFDVLKHYKNIIIKWGRYIPNQKEHYDEVLGVKLASDNQYAEVISDVQD